GVEPHQRSLTRNLCVVVAVLNFPEFERVVLLGADNFGFFASYFFLVAFEGCLAFANEGRFFLFVFRVTLGFRLFELFGLGEFGRPATSALAAGVEIVDGAIARGTLAELVSLREFYLGLFCGHQSPNSLISSPFRS